jgi:hypothetical protein
VCVEYSSASVGPFVLPPVPLELFAFVPEEVEFEGAVDPSDPGPKDGLLSSVPDE